MSVLDPRDIKTLAAKHSVSPSVIIAILRRAIKVARAFESGKPPGVPKPRKTLTVTLTKVPVALVADVDAWAQMRGKSRRDAACELLKVGLDVTSARVEKQIAASLGAVTRAQKRHTSKACL